MKSYRISFSCSLTLSTAKSFHSVRFSHRSTDSHPAVQRKAQAVQPELKAGISSRSCGMACDTHEAGVGRVCNNRCLCACQGICGAQPAHCDIRNQSHLWENDPPLSGIVALENGTSLLILRDSLEDYGGKLEKVVLNAGDVLVFPGLLVHAGSGYMKLNKRIHFTALSKSSKSRPINETFIVMSK